MVIHTIASAADSVEQVPLEEERLDCTAQLAQEIEAATYRSLISLLWEYRDIFAFGPEKMPGIDPTVAEHKLNVGSLYKAVIQKKRHMGPERAASATAEVQKPLEAGFIRECQYPDWISNVVLVKKPNGTWRMCLDFTDLNKACPKDSYPLLKIDKLVDAIARHALLSFMGAFSV